MSLETTKNNISGQTAGKSVVNGPDLHETVQIFAVNFWMRIFFSWKEKHEIYDESMDYFKFIDSADEKITWLDATRNDLESQLGTGLDTLEATEKTQLKQHGINTLIEAQSEPIKALHQVENSFDQETLESKVGFHRFLIEIKRRHGNRVSTGFR